MTPVACHRPLLFIHLVNAAVMFKRAKLRFCGMQKEDFRLLNPVQIQDYLLISVRYRSASRAAWQPVPAATTA